MGKLARLNAERRRQGAFTLGRMRDTGKPITVEDIMLMVQKKVQYKDGPCEDQVTAFVDTVQGVEGTARIEDRNRGAALATAKKLLLDGIRLRLMQEELQRRG